MPDVLTNRDAGDEAPDRPLDPVTLWRFEELERAGYPLDIAVRLAENRAVDLDLARRLLAEGASIHQALRILT